MTFIRIHNNTGHDLDLVTVRPPTPGAAPVRYGPLPNNAVSDYELVPDARSAAAVEAVGPGVELVLQPYDLVGEEPLGAGHFTYRLGTTSGRLSLDLVTDGPPPTTPPPP